MDFFNSQILYQYIDSLADCLYNVPIFLKNNHVIILKYHVENACFLHYYGFFRFAVIRHKLNTQGTAIGFVLKTSW